MRHVTIGFQASGKGSFSKVGYFGMTKHMTGFYIQYDYEKETQRYVTISLDADRY